MPPLDLGAAVPAIVITIVLVLANGFFVAAEYAFVRVRPTQLAELEGPRVRVARRIVERIDAYIGAAQVGVTLSSLGLGWIGEPAVAAVLEAAFGPLVGASEALLHILSFGIAFAIITYLHIVVGEVAPKYLSIQRTLSVALFVAYPFEWFYRLVFPFTWLVNRGANALLRVLGVQPVEELDAHSEEELRMLVAVSTRRGILQESERVIVGNALDFADTFVRQVMVPRTEIVAVPEDTALEGLYEMARQHPFSRYPVYREDLDHIVGAVHLKDLVGREPPLLARDAMRRATFVPETMRLDQALAEFRRHSDQLAVVLDEFGGTAGLITLEDIVEELVGEVRDGSEREAQPFADEAPGVHRVDGLTSIEMLRERLGLDLQDEPYDTVGGLVFGRLGRVAEVGDVVDVDGHRFEVTAVDGRRVAQVRITAPARRP